MYPMPPKKVRELGRLMIKRLRVLLSGGVTVVWSGTLGLFLVEIGLREYIALILIWILAGIMGSVLSFYVMLHLFGVWLSHMLCPLSLFFLCGGGIRGRHCLVCHLILLLSY